ncbi:MAG: hypothetical protein DHS80DRAFT_22127 [Piptocephalis tieghemiana]|nr:MAG: hypothetical protein DHS80DRAFT_22127 [Piptocephalis tieghemiana]
MLQISIHILGLLLLTLTLGPLLTSAASAKTAGTVAPGGPSGRTPRFPGAVLLPDLESEAPADEPEEKEGNPKDQPDSPFFNLDGTWKEVGEKEPIVISNMTLAIVQSGAPQEEKTARISAQSRRLEAIVNKVRDEHSRYCTRNAWGVTVLCPHSPFRIYANVSVLADLQSRWPSGFLKMFKSSKPCSPNGRGDMVGTLDTLHRSVEARLGDWMCAFVHKTWGKRERRIWTMDPSGAHAVATLARAFPEVDPSSPSSNRLRRRNSIGTTGLTHSPLDPSMMKPTTEHMAEERDAVLEEAKEEEQGLGKEVEEKQEALQNTTMTMGFWPEADPDGPVELTTRTLAIIGADTPPWQVDAHTKAQAVRLNNIISTISANHSMYCEHSGILGTRQVCPSSGYRIYANASVIETVAPYWISWKTWWRKLIPCSTPSSNTTRSIAIFHSPHRDIKVICT